MYYINNSPTVSEYDLDQKTVISVEPSEDGKYVLIVTFKDVILLHAKTLTLLLKFVRSETDIQTNGHTICALWKWDNSYVILFTALGTVLFFKMKHIDEISSGTPYESGYSDSKTSDYLSLHHVVSIPSEPLAVCSIGELMMVATSNGCFIWLAWDGSSIYQPVSIPSITYFLDFQNTHAPKLISERTTCLSLEWAPAFGGVFALLSPAHVVLILSNGSSWDKMPYQGILVESTNKASSISVNNRFRLLAVGTEQSTTLVYRLDEDTGVIQLHHVLSISDREYPGASDMIGAVTQTVWSPDGYSLVVAWALTGWSMWSVFGGLLYTSLSECLDSSNRFQLSHVTWTHYGYHILALIMSQREQNNAMHSLPSPSVESDCSSSLIVYHMARSALTTNPTSHNHHHIVLQTADCVMFSNGDHIIQVRYPQILQLPHQYINPNWPIRYVAVSEDGLQLAVAGSNGFTHYNFTTQSWHLFGNISQERSLHVFGGITWWKHYICLTCFTENYDASEVRIYPSNRKLDNRFATIYQLPKSALPVIVDSVANWFVLFTNDGVFRSFTLTESVAPKDGIILKSHHQINLDKLILFPACVVRLLITSLKNNAASNGRHSVTDNDAVNSSTTLKQQHSILHEIDNLFINYAGQLFVLHFSHQNINDTSIDGAVRCGNEVPTPQTRPTPFITPSLIASGVELIWTPPLHLTTHSHELHDSTAQSTCIYLHNSFWLYCGASGLFVWLPLASRLSTTSQHNLTPPNSQINQPSFESDFKLASKTFILSSYHEPRRIMLSIDLDRSVHPLMILVQDGMVVGIQNDFYQFWHKSKPTDVSISTGSISNDRSVFPYGVLKLEIYAFLHKIIQQLLRKNLGVHAYYMCLSYKQLPYFHRILELLMHEVLESEATSKSPIPDPLLPQVVAFIQEFPNFLEILAHCSRKTDVIWWPYLFASVGRRPKDLFELCLITNRLETAALYLIILQSSESALFSWECAKLLLKTAVCASKWNLVRDLLRFLNTIDPIELQTPTNRDVNVFDFCNVNTSPVFYSEPITGPGITNLNMRTLDTGQTSLSSFVKTATIKSDSTECWIHPNYNEKYSVQTTAEENSTDSTNCSTDTFDLRAFLNKLAVRLFTCGHLKTATKLIINFVETEFQNDEFTACHVDSAQTIDALAKWINRNSYHLDHIQNWSGVLVQLHQDFGLSFPSNNSSLLKVEPTEAKPVTSSASFDYLPTELERPGLDSQRLSSSVERDKFSNQIRYLLDQLLSAHSYEWASLLCVICLDKNALGHVLSLVITNGVPVTNHTSSESSVIAHSETSQHKTNSGPSNMHKTLQTPKLTQINDPTICETLNNVITGLNSIDQWAANNNEVYHEFIVSFQTDLDTIIETSSNQFGNHYSNTQKEHIGSIKSVTHSLVTNKVNEHNNSTIDSVTKPLITLRNIQLDKSSRKTSTTMTTKQHILMNSSLPNVTILPDVDVDPSGNHSNQTPHSSVSSNCSSPVMIDKFDHIYGQPYRPLPEHRYWLSAINKSKVNQSSTVDTNYTTPESDVDDETVYHLVDGTGEERNRNNHMCTIS